MFRKIIGTIGTRVISAFLTLLISVLNARFLGAENVGTIFLITLSVTYIQLFNNFIGGGALVYMTPRASFFKLFVSSYAWTLGITIIGTLLFYYTGTLSRHLEVIPHGYFTQVLALAFVMSFTSANYMLLLGKEKVEAYNILTILQIIVLIICLVAAVFLFHVRTVMAYYWAILISYLISFLFSFFPLLKFLKAEPLTGLKPIFRAMFRFGTYSQFANIFQLMNYRIGYYMVDFWFGRAALGVMGLGFSISEGLWIISRSLAMVQFTRISNAMDFNYSVQLTLILSKITIVVTSAAVLCLVALPEVFFRMIFGPEFGMIRTVIACLGTGIIALSFGMILSHFFSGINKPYHNTISSAIGLVFTLGLGLLLVPKYGIIGASITASVSYIVSTIYQFIVFSRMSRLKPRDFLLTRAEIKLLLTEIRNITWKADVADLN
ncbi:MAG: polysaccharide biosynthesis C-terminal domain-containing protein [Bacteroidetes bacterium]|nr:polysaccharide biosynthesis C-terminal domain-containing protein [Bacteroidota bacterium]